jgi:hypothetical protein
MSGCDPRRRHAGRRTGERRARARPRPPVLALSIEKGGGRLPPPKAHSGKEGRTRPGPRPAFPCGPARIPAWDPPAGQGVFPRPSIRCRPRWRRENCDLMPRRANRTPGVRKPLFRRHSRSLPGPASRGGRIQLPDLSAMRFRPRHPWRVVRRAALVHRTNGPDRCLLASCSRRPCRGLAASVWPRPRRPWRVVRRAALVHRTSGPDRCLLASCSRRPCRGLVASV